MDGQLGYKRQDKNQFYSFATTTIVLFELLHTVSLSG